MIAVFDLMLYSHGLLLEDCNSVLSFFFFVLFHTFIYTPCHGPKYFLPLQLVTYLIPLQSVAENAPSCLACFILEVQVFQNYKPGSKELPQYPGISLPKTRLGDMAALKMGARETFVPNVTIRVNVTICLSPSQRTVELNSLSTFAFFCLSGCH